MKYNELTVSEKNELRESLFYGAMHDEDYTDFCFLSEESKQIVRNCEWAEDIPEAVMEEAYEMYDFVESDFFCDMEDQFCDRLGNPKTA